MSQGALLVEYEAKPVSQTLQSPFQQHGIRRRACSQAKGHAIESEAPRIMIVLLAINAHLATVISYEHCGIAKLLIVLLEPWLVGGSGWVFNGTREQDSLSELTTCLTGTWTSYTFR
jgi:hypothetical protein